MASFARAIASVYSFPAKKLLHHGRDEREHEVRTAQEDYGRRERVREESEKKMLRAKIRASEKEKVGEECIRWDGNIVRDELCT